MLMLEWLGLGLLILAFLGATGLLVGAVLRSPMHVDDECEPTAYAGQGTTKARLRSLYKMEEPSPHRRLHRTHWHKAPTGI